MEKGQGSGMDTLATDKVFTRKEYIEREAALEAVDNADVMCDIHPDAYRVLRRYIERIPASDVVSRDCYDRLLVENDELRKERPVVLCRDCKHRDPEDKKCDCGGLEHAHMFPVADDWFCADGEKREVEHG